MLAASSEPAESSTVRDAALADRPDEGAGDGRAEAPARANRRDARCPSAPRRRRGARRCRRRRPGRLVVRRRDHQEPLARSAPGRCRTGRSMTSSLPRTPRARRRATVAQVRVVRVEDPDPGVGLGHVERRTAARSRGHSASSTRSRPRRPCLRRADGRQQRRRRLVHPLEVAGTAELDLAVEQPAYVVGLERRARSAQPRPRVELPAVPGSATNRVKGPTSTASAIGRGTAS